MTTATKLMPHTPRRSARRAPTTRIQVNFVALAVSVTLGVIVAASAYFVHGIQMRRIAGAFLVQAERHEEQSEWREAADYLFRYLRLKPEDTSAHVRLAEVYDESATTPATKTRSIDLYYRAFGLAAESMAPEKKDELRRRLIELLIERQRFTEAEQECNTLLAGPSGADDAPAYRQLAIALYGQHLLGDLSSQRNGSDAAGAVFERAVELNPKAVDLSATWALILRDTELLLNDQQRERWPQRPDRVGQADQVMDQLVANNPADGEAYLARYLYRQAHQLPDAEADLNQAIAIRPEDPNTLMLAANYFQGQAARSLSQSGSQDDSQADYERARQFYERAIAVAPSQAAAYIGLSDVLVAEGQIGPAIEQLQKGQQSISEPNPLLLLRLAELLIRQQRGAEAREILDAYQLSTTGRRQDTNAMLALDRTELLLQSQLLMTEGDYSRAIASLRTVTNEATAEPRVLAIAWSQLGRCYLALQSWDQAATAFEAASTFSQEEISHRAAAAAWLNASQPQRAITNLQSALAVVNSPATKFELARAHLANQLTTTGSRDWQPLATLLTELQQTAQQDTLPNAWQLPLLEAEYVVARSRDLDQEDDGIRRALELLRAADQQFADERGYWEQATLRYQTLGSPADADRALNQFTTLDETRPADSYLLRARLSTRRGQTDEARQLLTTALQAAPAAERPALERELAQLDVAEGKALEVIDRLPALAQDTGNLALLVQVGLLQLSERNLAAAQKVENSLREQEGPEGTLWRYLRATRLLSQAQSATDADFSEVVQLQRELQDRRPNWYPAFTLKAQIETGRGNNDLALQALIAAIDLGERRTFVYERLVRLLYQAGRFAEAGTYLARLERATPMSQELSSVAISLSARDNDLARAETLARQAVDARPTDPVAWIWYSQTLVLNKQHDVAEQAIRKAIEVAPQDARGWNVLFDFLLKTGERARARKLLPEMAAAIQVSDAEKAFLLAQSYELLQDVEQASQKYDQATSLEPDNIAIQSRKAMFLVRNQLPTAKDELGRLLRITAGKQNARQAHAEARQMLALLLLSEQGEGSLPEAFSLLQGPDGKVTDLDKRLQATLLTRQQPPNFDQAQPILEQLVIDSRAPADPDRLLLAWVYAQQAKAASGQQRDEKLLQARRLFDELCVRENPQATHLVRFVDFLLDQADWQEANRWLDRLRQVEPANEQLVGLQTRWVRDQTESAGGLEQRKQLLEQLGQRLLRDAKTDAAKSLACLTVGQIYAQLEMPAEAEPWFAQALVLDPELIAIAARSFVNKQDAIALCQRIAGQSDQPYAATELAGYLFKAELSESELAAAEALLTKALETHPSDALLATSVGNLRIQQKRTAEAIQLYQASIQNDPENAIALNNLATLLSQDPDQRMTALDYANQAIKLIGPVAPLLDTKGTILLQIPGRENEALDMLQAAVAAGNDPRYQFHLALAWQRVGQLDKAREAFATAEKNDLMGQLLTEEDLTMLDNLKAALN